MTDFVSTRRSPPTDAIRSRNAKAGKGGGTLPSCALLLLLFFFLFPLIFRLPSASHGGTTSVLMVGEGGSTKCEESRPNKVRDSSNRNGVKKTTSGFDVRKGARLPASEAVIEPSRSGGGGGGRRRRLKKNEEE
ncbi:hypothetical protein J3458_000071 [Metarhizium acridum]|uniref:uncharacterized protein n=1 Tax=Metarhizium acridum TaxID=92637 RepID=UPI001C6B8DC1|nr:hypothetical protein J3458_000071 [Metarhizium acridum]